MMYTLLFDGSAAYSRHGTCPKNIAFGLSLLFVLARQAC